MSGFANTLIGLDLGGFVIKRMIARGGMGIVYEGYQQSLNRPVAIKILYPHLSEDESFRDRFQQEARAIALLRHPNIVGVIDYGSAQGYHFMVMDLVSGQSLRDELANRHEQGKAFTTSEAIYILEEVGKALTYAHSRGFIHRDIKPANILVDLAGNVFLTDFGLVRLADSQGMTMTGQIVGTPEYMAPEQSLGNHEIGQAADQYALAVVAYQLFVGRVPFKAPTPVGVIQKHINEPPPPPHTIVSWFPPEVERVLMRGLAKDPANRFPSIDAFVRAIASVAGTMDSAPSVPVASIDESAPPPAVTPPIQNVEALDTLIEPLDAAPAPVAATVEPVVADAPSSVAAASVVTAPEPEPYAPDALAASSVAPADANVIGERQRGGRKPLFIVLLLILLAAAAGVAYTVMSGGDDNDDEPGIISNTPQPASTSLAGQATQQVVTGTDATQTTAALPAGATAPLAATSRATTAAAPTVTRDTGTPRQPTATVPPIGEVTGPAATVELRNYLSVPATIVLEGLGAVTIQPGEIASRPLPAGTWHYLETAPGYAPLEGDITWEENGVFFWEFYDPLEVEIVEIRNNLGVPMFLNFDGYGEIFLEAGESRIRAFPAREYSYTFRADGFQDATNTITFTAGQSTVWPWDRP